MNIRDLTWKILRNQLLQENGQYFVNDEEMDLFYTQHVDYPVIKEKIHNLVTKLNSLSPEELGKFKDLDFQKEIWELI